MEGEALVDRGREAHARQAWAEAHAVFARADEEAGGLRAEDLERLAVAAYMLGRAEGFEEGMERACAAHLAAGNRRAAALCAIWEGIHLAGRRQLARAGGLFARAQRALEPIEDPSVERAYLLVPRMLQQTAQGELEAAYATAAEAYEVAARFADADLGTVAIHQQGRIRVRQGRLEEGLRLLDEAMAAVLAGHLSPILTGIVYCSALAACRDADAVGRAREWTRALSAWCARQPDMAAFTGECLVFRAETLQLLGDWHEAQREARRAHERFADAMDPMAAAHAFYRQGEVLRLQGALAEAEEAYLEAGRRGWDPQPGLAWLRLAQGRVAVARTALDRALQEAPTGAKRGRLLAAAVQAALRADDTASAATACRELEDLQDVHDTALLAGTCGLARAEVALAEGTPRAAAAAAQRAAAAWRALEAPYETARARELLGHARLALGDREAGTFELDAAREAYARLGAEPDHARVQARLERRDPRHGLTAREQEVLRLLATGASNKAIARELSVSRRTVDRHVANLFVKLEVSSRAAATAYAHRHGLA